MESIKLAVTETSVSRELLLSQNADKAAEAKKRLAAAVEGLSASERKYGYGTATTEKLEKVQEQYAKLSAAQG